MQVYDIVKQTKYGIEISEVDIEDASDEFLTQEEIDELEIYPWLEYQTIDSAIKEAIEGWLAQIPEGKRSIKCTDTDLIDILADNQLSISEFVDNTRRVGDRIYKHEPKTTVRVLKASDLALLINVVETFYRQKQLKNFVQLKGNLPRKYETIPVLKRLITWEELVEFNKIDEETLNLIKPLWDNPEIGPTLFPEKKKKV